MCEMPCPSAADDVVEIGTLGIPAQHSSGSVGTRDKLGWIAGSPWHPDGLDLPTGNLPVRLDDLKD